MMWILPIVVIVVGWLIYVFNSLISLSNRAANAWADIDVQLRRRYDLVPNLVEVVKGYAAHERSTFEKVAAARSTAQSSHSPSEKTQSEPVLISGIRSLFALAEAYPELKANEEFLSLQNNLVEIEDTLQSARRYYNAVVRDLNTKIQSFPTNILAGMFGFQQRQFFEGTAEDRAPVAVKF
jgi:LemA protein